MAFRLTLLLTGYISLQVLNSTARADVCVSANFPRVLGATDGDTYAYCVAQDGAGNYYLGGKTESDTLSGSTGSYPFVAKFDSSISLSLSYTITGNTYGFTQMDTCLGDTSTQDIWFVTDETLTIVFYDSSAGTFAAKSVDDGSVMTDISVVKDIGVKSSNLYMVLQRSPTSSVPLVIAVDSSLSLLYIQTITNTDKTVTAYHVGCLFPSGSKLYIHTL
jgi:hypothetical protein